MSAFQCTVAFWTETHFSLVARQQVMEQCTASALGGGLRYVEWTMGSDIWTGCKETELLRPMSKGREWTLNGEN
jgi:hypothetical protein